MTTPRKPMDTVTPGDHRLLRIDDVAERLSVSRSFAWKLIAQGDIRSVRFGRSVRIRPSDLEAFINGSTREG